MVLYIVVTSFKAAGIHGSFDFAPLPGYLSVEVSKNEAEHGFQFRCQMVHTNSQALRSMPKTPWQFMKCHSGQHLTMRMSQGVPEGLCHPEVSHFAMQWHTKRLMMRLEGVARDVIGKRAPLVSLGYTSFTAAWERLTESGRQEAMQREQEWMRQYWEAMLQRHFPSVPMEIIRPRAAAAAGIRPRPAAQDTRSNARGQETQPQPSNGQAGSSRGAGLGVEPDECLCPTTLGGCSCIPIGSRGPQCRYCIEQARQRQRVEVIPGQVVYACLDLEAAARTAYMHQGINRSSRHP